MTTAVKCNVQMCKHNGGMFCKKPVVFIGGGICSELVDRNGNQIPPEVWMRRQEETTQDFEDFNDGGLDK